MIAFRSFVRRLLTLDDPLMDEDMDAYYEAVRPYTMLSKARLYSLLQAVEYVVKNNIPGDLVECGVYKGGACMLMAYALDELGASRKIWLYDTFTGMPRPHPEHDKKTGHEHQDMVKHWQAGKDGLINRWCYSSAREVISNMERTGYKDFELVPGLVEDTIPRRAPRKIAILRLDTDFYSSTAHELKHLYPLLSPGGVLLIDDYGAWTGARQAVDEYFKGGGPLLVRVDHTGRTGVRP